MAQHELRDLAVRLAALRRVAPNQAQRILGQYHHAYRDLAGALAGVRDEDLDRAPAPGEWPVRDVTLHMLDADHGFLAVVQYARAPDRPSDPKEAEERWQSWREEHGYRAPKTLEGGIAAVRNALFEIHRRILRELADLTDADLERTAQFWDGDKPVRFRLHRFEAHYVQHTIQVDKTLEAIGRGPTEARRLVRVLYRDLAPIEMLSEVREAAAEAAGDGDRGDSRGVTWRSWTIPKPSCGTGTTSSRERIARTTRLTASTQSGSSSSRADLGLDRASSTSDAVAESPSRGS